MIGPQLCVNFLFRDENFPFSLMKTVSHRKVCKQKVKICETNSRFFSIQFYAGRRILNNFEPRITNIQCTPVGMIFIFIAKAQQFLGADQKFFFAVFLTRIKWHSRRLAFLLSWNKRYQLREPFDKGYPRISASNGTRDDLLFYCPRTRDIS